MFKTWEKIVAEHEELGKMMTEKHELLNNRVREWNNKIAPLTREEKALREKLLTNSYYLKKFDLDISVNFMKGEYRSVYLVSITLTDTSNGQQKTRTYRFQ